MSRVSSGMYDVLHRHRLGDPCKPSTWARVESFIHERPVSHVEVALCSTRPLIIEALPKPTPHVLSCWQLITPNIDSNNITVLHPRDADQLYMYHGRTGLNACKRQFCARGN